MSIRYPTSLLGLCLATAAAGLLSPAAAQQWVMPRNARWSSGPPGNVEQRDDDAVFSVEGTRVRSTHPRRSPGSNKDLWTVSSKVPSRATPTALHRQRVRGSVTTTKSGSSEVIGWQSLMASPGPR